MIKACIINPFLLLAQVAGLCLMLAGQVKAQTLTTLYSFTGGRIGGSQAGVILSGSTLYGTTAGGGSSSNGTVFAVNTDGTGFTTLHSFTGFANWTNGDGADPTASLILSGNTLYGTTDLGGSSGVGTVFALKSDGTGFTVLHDFEGIVCAACGSSSSGLVLFANTLYGTTAFNDEAGGLGGTVFALNTDGTGFTYLHGLTAARNDTNSDGALPLAGLILSSNTLYGTAVYGGSWDNGTVFKVNTDGTGFRVLHTFTATSGSPPWTNIDGAIPVASLLLSGNILYGTALDGGAWGSGTVFKVNTDGTGFTTLYNFTGGSDGAYPWGDLIFSGNTLYGTASGGGISGNGVVFAVNTDGTGLTTLHSFGDNPAPYNTNSDGATPQAGLTLSGNTLYGTTTGGGSSGWGTIFSLSLPPPQLTIIRSEANMILTWPTNATGFTLQTTANLASPVWTTNLSTPFVVNGQNTVTNPISGTQQFFRLSP